MTAANVNDQNRERERELCAMAMRGWYAAFKNARLYSPNHPAAKEACEKMRVTLGNLFTVKFELTIEHSDGLFFVDEMFFIEESLSMYDLLHLMEVRRIGKVLFLPGITAEELSNLSLFLLDSKGTESGWKSDHVQAIERVEKEEIKEEKKAPIIYTQCAAFYDELLALTEKIFGKLMDEQNIPVAELAQPLDKLLDDLHQHAAFFSAILCTRKPAQLHLEHSLNTTILSVYLGQQLGFDVASVKVLALSSLFHDVGRWLLPSEFTTDYVLTEEDVAFIQLHTRDGASFLAGVPGLPMNVIRVALEHHRSHDGIGYPVFSESHSSHVFSQIIALADFVSWATLTDKHYHKPAAPHRLVRSVLRRAGNQFSPLLVKLLLPFFGIFPPGTKLRLNSGKIAVVLLPNLKNIQHPHMVGLDSALPSANSSDIKSVAGTERNIASLFERLSFVPQTQNS